MQGAQDQDIQRRARMLWERAGSPAGRDFEFWVRAVNGEAPPPTEEEREIIRQSERTVDNLKRLFAFIFSLSFGAIGTGAIEKIRPILMGQTPPPSLDVWVLNIEMLAIFAVTAGVFFHQSAKYLDNRYAKHPITPAKPFGFAIDYITQVFTAAPFFFMSFTFAPLVTHAVGYIGFFGFYLVVFILGLILLLFAIFRHDPPIIYLHTYWFLMNSAVLFFVLALFQFFVWRGTACPTSPKDGHIPLFLFFFGIVAFLRDVFDYRWAWRFVYPVAPRDAPDLDVWPITKIRSSENWRRASIVIGVIFVILSILLIFLTLQLWDFAHWAQACAIRHTP